MIDGGSLVSGFVGRANPFQPGAGTSFDNVEGGIVRSSAGYALAFTNGFSSVRVMNAGGSVIENIGTGDAIFSFSDLNITNEATSRITTTGNRAINAQRGLTLTNRGVITGNISVTNVAIQGVNAIDNLGGTINGNVALSAFNDRVLTSFGTQTALAGGITGTLDGGAGFDSLSLNVTGTKTIDTAITLPTGFEEVSFSIGNGLDGKVVDGTLILNPGASLPGKLVITEIPEYAPDDLPISSKLINNANLTMTGPAVEAILTLSPLDFTNNGSITANLANPANQGVTLQGAIKTTNTGTITGNAGVALALNGNGLGSLNNSGMIAADYTGLIARGGTFVNSGTIRSNLGAAVIFGGIPGNFNVAQASTFANSGTITGVIELQVGDVNSIAFASNSGTITGTTNGVTVELAGLFDNKTGGTVNGGVIARGSSTLRNAGTINGNTSVAGNFYAADGGVINGDLTLANLSTVFMNVANVAQPNIAGVTGTVNALAGTQRLRLVVSQDLTTPVTTPFGVFDEVGYRLENGAKLTASSATPLTTILDISGHGTADLTADMTGSTAASLLAGQSLGTMLKLNGEVGGGPLSIISRGNLTKTTALEAVWKIGLWIPIGGKV